MISVGSFGEGLDNAAQLAFFHALAYGRRGIAPADLLVAVPASLRLVAFCVAAAGLARCVARCQGEPPAPGAA